MQKMSHRFVLIIAMLTTAFLLTGCETLTKLAQGLNKPSARVTGASISDLNLDQAGLLFDVEVSNPYDIAMPLASLDYAINSGGKKFVSGEKSLSGTVPAGGTRTIQLPVNVVFQDALNILSGVKPGEVVPYEASLNLTADAPALGPITLPIKRSGELPVPVAPQVKLTDLSVKKLTLTNVEANVALDVTNNNKFNLGVRNLAYDLSLGGTRIASAKLDHAAKLSEGETANMSFPIQFSPLSFGRSVFNMLSGSEAGYAITGSVAGDTPFGPINLPYSKTGNVPISR